VNVPAVVANTKSLPFGTFPMNESLDAEFANKIWTLPGVLQLDPYRYTVLMFGTNGELVTDEVWLPQLVAEAFVDPLNS